MDKHSPTPLSKDDLQKINARIKELTEIVESDAERLKGKGLNRFANRTELNSIKELRRLRREMDNHEII